MKRAIRRLVNRLKSSLAIPLLLLVSACSGGTTAALLVAEGGIGGTGISFGSIIGFGSVIVNGSRLEVSNQTSIFVDEQPATQDDLRIGYVIRADADFDTGFANRIDYVETVRGPLAAVPQFDPDTLIGGFSLLGQNVITNSATIIDGAIDLSTLKAADILDVSGVRDSSGVIIARYVELKSPSASEYRVVGVIDNATATTFTIGNLLVGYAGADISGLGGAAVENGIEVRVRGAAADFDAGNITLLAAVVSDSVLRIDLQNGDGIELEGAVTGFNSLADMTVDGKAVDASAALIENGGPGDVRLDTLVEVEGTVDAAGVIVAGKLKIIQLGKIRVDANVDFVDVGGKSVTVLGEEFLLDDKTLLRDRSSAAIDQFSLNDLLPGDWVELRAYFLDGQYRLLRLERNDPDDVILQAPIDQNGVDAGNSSLSILGITVFTDSNTDYEDVSRQAISEAQFFSGVADGDLVKARWRIFTSILIPVSELSQED